MSQHSGPNVPHRTGRKLALEKGTDPGKFSGKEWSDEESAAGHKAMPNLPADTYRGKPPAVSNAAPPKQDTPFTLGGTK